MKIGFISDTHGNIKDTLRALEILESCDRIFHMGDILAHGPRNPLTNGYEPKNLSGILSEIDNITYVRGNCDADVDEMVLGKDVSKSEIFEDLGEFKLYGVHGYLESDGQRIQRAKDLGTDLVVWGHSHIKVLERLDGLVLLNPGSTTLPKDGSKSLGLYEDGIFSLVDLDSKKTIKKLEL